MRYRIPLVVLCIVGLVYPRFSFSAPVLADGTSVVFNELMWMGSSASSADEWIELRNMTDQPVDLSNWVVTKKSNGLEVPMITIPSGKILTPSGLFVISNYSSSSTSSILNGLADVVTTDVALSNSALQLRLYNSAQQVIDVADDGVGNPLAGAYDSSKKLFASMERNPLPGDGMLAQNWHTASRGLGFKTGAVEFGTPGMQNSNGIPVARAGSDQQGIVGQSLNFDGTDSTDPEQQPLTFQWNFGDGTLSSEATPSHVFTAAGAYTVTLTVNDGFDSASDAQQVTMNAAPAAPTSTTSPSSGNSTSVGDEITVTLATTTSCLGLHISELYPNPQGVDVNEFIELFNDGDEDIVTGSCLVFSSTTRSYKIPTGTVIARGGYLLLSKAQTHLTLNNGGTTVRLVDSDGSELDRVTYATAAEGTSWAKNGAGWEWSSRPTPGEKNRVIAPAKKATPAKGSSTTAKPATTKKTEAPPQTVTLREIQELDSGDRVIVEGIVTVPRDVLGSTTAYIQNSEGGVSVVIPNGEPVIQVGQKIEVTGTVRLKSGRRYISVGAKGVHVISSEPEPVATKLATDDVGIEQADQLVHVQGVIALASGSTIQIDDGSGPVNAYIKSSTGIVRPKMKAGDTIDVIGVVGVSTSGVRVLPRTQNDIRVERVLGASTSIPTQVVTPPAASKSQTIWYWSLVALGALVASAKPVWRKLREKKKAHD